jgi:hypothetical protein
VAGTARTPDASMHRLTEVLGFFHWAGEIARTAIRCAAGVRPLFRPAGPRVVD